MDEFSIEGSDDRKFVVSSCVSEFLKNLNQDTFILSREQGWGSGELRAVFPHQCDQGSIPALGVILCLSLMVPFSALRGFSQGIRFFLLTGKKNYCRFDLD